MGPARGGARVPNGHDPARLELPDVRFLHAERGVRQRSVEPSPLKKTIEISLSVLLLIVVVLVLLWRRSSVAEKYLACGAMGIAIGFWLHRDAFYLLLH